MAKLGNAVWSVTKTDAVLSAPYGKDFHVKYTWALNAAGKLLLKKTFLKADMSVDFCDGWKVLKTAGAVKAAGGGDAIKAGLLAKGAVDVTKGACAHGNVYVCAPCLDGKVAA